MAKGTKVTDIVKLMVHKYPINQKWKPNELISFYWNVYTSEFESNNSVNGGVFEQLLVLALLREKISPVYVQAELAFVPNVILDIVLYNRKTPITISAKTTLRERWKQADLEAMATKYVHREALCYVVTLSENEVLARRKEENSYMGINDFVLAHTDEFNQLVEKLKQIQITESESIKIIQSDHKFYDKDSVEKLYQIEI
ncbi:hypothetical protein Q7267_03290 [Glaesserella parasuis]|uniref:Type I restriction enzyme R protein N-terminal domain-containing protein n=4 Tax=Glaesserella parasuis TaxID=738 RepID=B8F3P9_GLAP5|nr:hypothetical protein [Glaesserella parasuis]AGO16249.1 hypothetical protein K756_05255 [Glaesserella parasuis ZJ0906]EQA06539.1 hypothetical protein HPS12939_0083 [Glaesserella parasuis 12939]ACL31951.1 hypothetical protein HAPS_0262 [Glaesserella parasuis SH0165]AIK17148.1 hypothetical protein JL26_04760 [Glaesserella parasuis]AIK89652.1 hypothetical protein JT17_02305 [Glaesserella parasuis]